MFFSNKKNIFILIILFLIIFVAIYFFTKEESYEYLDNEILYVSSNTMDNTPQKAEIIIHITGEVINPGIVILNEGARIDDAISEAGGTTELADVSKVNLAYELRDGQKIYIPSIFDNSDIVSVEDTAGDNIIVSGNSTSNLVNINTANQSELETLPGIRRVYC